MKISRNDFAFKYSSNGYYFVTYTSPKTYKEYKTIISSMILIDATMNTEEPKQTNLKHLKTLCKC